MAKTPLGAQPETAVHIPDVTSAQPGMAADSRMAVAKWLAFP